MKKFEYKIVSAELDKKYKIEIDVEGTEDLLTGEGLGGWEAVSSFTSPTIMGKQQVFFLMKREILDLNL